MARFPVHVPGVGTGEISFKGKCAYLGALLINKVNCLGVHVHMSVFATTHCEQDIAENLLAMDDERQQYMGLLCVVSAHPSYVSLN